MQQPPRSLWKRHSRQRHTRTRTHTTHRIVYKLMLSSKYMQPALIEKLPAGVTRITFPKVSKRARCSVFNTIALDSM